MFLRFTVSIILRARVAHNQLVHYYLELYIKHKQNHRV